MYSLFIDIVMKSFSQASQDLFCIKAHGFKKNGTFLEIGTNDPIIHNNTYLLESLYNWKGILVEYDKAFEHAYIEKRPNSKYFINDAQTLDYSNILDTLQFPSEIDYLQIDLDVNNRSTLNVLEILDETVFDKYTFGVITFEHDIYSGNYFDTQTISRKILTDRGYVLVFPNVSVLWEGSYKPFEDWYVHPELVDMNYINKLISTDSLTVEQIKTML